MGRSHAISGAAGWLGLCLAASTWTDLEPTVTNVIAGTVVAAGAARWPDVDHEGSSVARGLGPVTWLLSRVVSFVSDWVRDRTCGCCATEKTRGHRTLTHTVLFALAFGAVMCLVGWLWSDATGAAVVGAGVWLAVQGWWPRLLALLGGAGAAAVVVLLVDPAGWWWLGVPIAAGMVIHVVGDAITYYGVPMWWPARIAGCRWQRVGTPEWMRFRTGGAVERRLRFLMVTGGLAAGWMLTGWQIPAWPVR